MTLIDDIRTKIRKVTGALSPSQLSQDEIDFAINTYYEYDFPSALKMLSEYKSISLYTEPNVDVYAFDTDLYYDIQPPLFVDGYVQQYVQDKTEFYKIWPKLKYVQTGATGDGLSGSFSFTVSAVPFLQSFPSNSEKEVLVGYISTTGNSITLTDEPLNAYTGTLADSGGTNTGTVNYITGAVMLSLTDIPGSDEDINIHVTPYVASRPQTIWFFQNQLTMRPVPDQQYELVFSAHLKPVPQLSTANPNPEIKQWWQLIAYGAAKIIASDSLDTEQLAQIQPLYEEQLRYVERRDLVQLSNQRAQTLFTSPTGMAWDLYNPTSGGN